MNRSNRFVRVASGLILLTLLIGCQSRELLLRKEKESDAHYKLGVAYLGENVPNVQKAYIEFIKTVEIDPKYKDGHYGLGHIYAQRQEYPKAITAFKKTLALDHEFSEAYNYLGTVYELSNQDAAAIVAYQEAIKNPLYITPQFPHWKLGLLYLRQKKYEAAISEFDAVRRIEPNNSLVFEKIGETYLQMGQQEKAREAFKKVVDIAPESPEAEVSLKRLSELQ